MTKLMPLVFATALLCGCPESKIPKIPPKAPEPKLLIDDKKTGDIPMSPAEHLAGTQLAKPRVPAINR